MLTRQPKGRLGGSDAVHYLCPGERDRVRQQEPLDVLSTGRSGEGALVGVVVVEVLGQHVPNVKATENRALSYQRGR